MMSSLLIKRLMNSELVGGICNVKNSEGHFDYNSLSSTKHCNTHALKAKEYKPQFAHRKVFTEIVQAYLLYMTEYSFI